MLQGSLKIILLSGLLLLSSLLYFNSRSTVQPQVIATLIKCSSLLPFNIWSNPQQDYYNWFGLQGTNIKGKNYLTGHAFERHIAVNSACTTEQKEQNKTVFLNLNQFQKAISKVSSMCDINNHTSFTYSYDGQFTAPIDSIQGIDCKTGVKSTFNTYFIQFKRAIKNAAPTQAQYLASNYVTIWTFYPKRVLKIV